MRKRVTVMATIGVLIVLIAATVAARAEYQDPNLASGLAMKEASSYPAGVTWTSPFIIQNIGSGNATISVEFREVGGSGAVAYTLTSQAPVPPRGVFTVRPQNIPNESLPANKKYSVVVSADQPVAAIVNEQASNQSAMGYAGAKAGATKLFFPNFNKNYSTEQWNTPIYVQNASTSAGSITVIFNNADTGAQVHSMTMAVPAGTAVEVDPLNVTQLADGRYSVQVVGTVNIVGALNQVSNVAGQEMSVTGITGGGRTIFLPNINKNYATENWITPVLVQNVGTAATGVTIEYYAVNVPGIQTGQLVKSYQLSGALGAGLAVTERPQNRPAAELPAGSYSAKVVSTASDIAATVNQQSANNPKNGAAMAYIGFTSGASRVFVPNINKMYGAEQWTTNVLIQNMGAGQANVTISYIADSAGTKPLTVPNVNIDPGRSFAERPRNRTAADLPDGKYSMVVESTNGVPLQIIVNQQSFASPQALGGIAVEGLVAQ